MVKGEDGSPLPRFVQCYEVTLTDHGLLDEQLATGEAAEVVMLDINAWLTVDDVFGQQ